MKVGVYYGQGDIRIEDALVPKAENDEVLVRVRTCGLCGTDLAKYRRQLVPPGTVLGHEVTGDVVYTGPRVRRIRQGDRVIVPHHIPCFVCDLCRHGSMTMCEDFRPTNIDPGGFAEYLRVRGPSVAKGVLRLPDSVSYDQASLAEPVACCLRMYSKVRILSGDRVVVIGAGPSGMIHVQLARLHGAGQVIVTDVLQNRLDEAAKLGADAAINVASTDPVEAIEKITDGSGADLVILAVGDVGALAQALKMAKPGGTVAIFAEYPEETRLSLDPNLMYKRDVTLTGSYSSTPLELRAALRLIESGRFDPDPLISHRLALNELQRAFDLAVDGKDVLKILIHPGEDA